MTLKGTISNSKLSVGELDSEFRSRRGSRLAGASSAF